MISFFKLISKNLFSKYLFTFSIYLIDTESVIHIWLVMIEKNVVIDY